MKRYLHEFNTANMPVSDTDVLIVGAGIAGLWTALHLSRSKNVTVIAKFDTESSNSWLAQGGVAAVIRSDDCFESHIKDTLTAGAGLCNEHTVDILVRQAPENIYELMELNVPFDRDEKGEPAVGREGGHSCRRILHSGGDATGRAITYALLCEVKKRPNITLLDFTLLCDLLTDDRGICGAVLKSKDGMFAVRTPHVVMASGGIGHLYRYTTNPRSSVGDGIAAAVRSGAETSMMEMVQFHPTTLMASFKEDRLFLISEAVRGEGAILRNHAGEAFMAKVHKMKDLAPRDIVTRGILAELARTGDEYAKLDVSTMTRAFFAGRFPTIFSKCLSYGIELTADPIPVHPAQHYFMGGITTDENGRTNIEGLWAVGECASNGIHGANRLASNSMLECLVFGRRAAFDIDTSERQMPSQLAASNKNTGTPSDTERITLLYESLRALMDEYVGAVRTQSGLLRAKQAVENMMAEADAHAADSDIACEFYSMLTVSKLIIDSAIERKDSVGAHYMVK